MSGKIVKRMIVGLALMLSIAASLVGGSTAANASPASLPGHSPEVNSPHACNYDILFNGVTAECLRYVSGITKIQEGVEVTVTRGTYRSVAFNNWISNPSPRNFAISFLDFNGSEIKRYNFWGAIVVRTTSGGPYQEVVIAACGLTVAPSAAMLPATCG